jgi:hypothetical protein
LAKTSLTLPLDFQTVCVYASSSVFIGAVDNDDEGPEVPEMSRSSAVFICLRKCWKFKPTQKGAAGYCWLFNENDLKYLIEDILEVKKKYLNPTFFSSRHT